MCQAIGKEENEAEFEEHWKSLDANSDGSVSLEEMLAKAGIKEWTTRWHRMIYRAKNLQKKHKEE